MILSNRSFYYLSFFSCEVGCATDSSVIWCRCFYRWQCNWTHFSPGPGEWCSFMSSRTALGCICWFVSECQRSWVIASEVIKASGSLVLENSILIGCHPKSVAHLQGFMLDGKELKPNRASAWQQEYSCAKKNDHYRPLVKITWFYFTSCCKYLLWKSALSNYEDTVLCMIRLKVNACLINSK